MASFFDRIRQSWQKSEVWPPMHVKKHWEEIAGYRTRYANDRSQMISANPNIGLSQHKVEIYVPVPWPRELCRFSAALLFSETPRVSIKGKGDAPVLENLLEVNDFGAFAIRGGVRTAAEGRVCIRVIRDTAISADTPLLTLINEDQIVWDIRHGSFYAGGMVVIERKVYPATSDPITYRLMEEHTAGLVTRTLYKGTDNELGKQVPITALDEFSTLAVEEHTGIDRPTLIPWENVPGSESDLFGLGPIFDELNEAESLLLDRGRKSIPRTFVDRTLADASGALDIDGYILTGGARMALPLGTAPSSTIETAVPGFLSQEHIAWVDHITQTLVTCAGYSPTTWGIQGQTASVQRAVSGYAMKLAQLRTLLNRSGKEHMALEAFGWSIATALAMQAPGSGSGKVADYLPSIQLGDGLPNDALDGAQEVLFLRQAMAASTEELVRTVHPTWTAAEVKAEASAIEASAVMPPGAGPALGLGKLPKTANDLLNTDDKAGDGIDDAPSISG